MPDPLQNLSFEFAVHLHDLFPHASAWSETSDEIKSERDDRRLNALLEHSKDWSRSDFKVFCDRLESELDPPLTGLNSKQLVQQMFDPDLTLGRALILCLGLENQTPLHSIPGKSQIEIVVALDTLAKAGSWEKPTNPTDNFHIKLRYGQFTILDEVLSLLQGTEFPVDENVKTCWRSIRNLDMPGRAMEPFIADEIIEKLFGDDEVDLCSQNTEELERLKATIKVLKSKIASLEDKEPKARISLEKIALGLALHRADYKPEASRQQAIKTIVKWIETVGLRIDAKTVRARLRDAYTNHSDDVDEWLRDEK